MTSNDVALPRADEGKREARQRGRRRVMMGKTMRYYLGNLRGPLVRGESGEERTQSFLVSVRAHLVSVKHRSHYRATEKKKSDLTRKSVISNVPIFFLKKCFFQAR